MLLTISQGPNRFQINATPQTTVSELMSVASKQGAFVENGRLVFCGAVLKDAQLSLEKYGITQDAKLMLLAYKSITNTKEEKAMKVHTSVAKIDDIVKVTMSECRPLLDAFKMDSSPDAYLKLSETLMKGILKLDCVSVMDEQGKVDDARRMHRKDAILTLQGLLKEADQMKKSKN